jgi:hypothetical protein
MTSPTEPVQSQQPVPVQVIGYASGQTLAGATTGVRVLLGILAGFHILLGAPSVVWAVIGGFENLNNSYGDPAVIVWVIIGSLVGAANIACGVWMLTRRRWTWRAAHFTLAALCVLTLFGCGFGAGVVVYYKHAQGWDALGLAIGLILFGGCSILFWLHALSKLSLLRLNVRRAYRLGDLEPHRLHRIGTFTAMSLYAVIVLVCGVWYLVR